MLTVPREGLCVVSLMPLNAWRASPSIGKVVALVSVGQQCERQRPLGEDIYIKTLIAHIRIKERPAAENRLLGNREEAAALFDVRRSFLRVECVKRGKAQSLWKEGNDYTDAVALIDNEI